MPARAMLDGVEIDPGRLRPLALVNYGHFTSMRVERSGVLGLADHLHRLTRDCRRLFEVDLDPERVRRWLRDAVAGVERPVLARVTVFDPRLDLATLGADAEPSVLVTLRPAGDPAPAAHLGSVVYQRELPEVKHVGLFGPVRLRRAALRRGLDDVLFTDAAGAVCETAIANIGFVAGERVVWPRADWLPGVTMRLLSAAVPTVTEPVTLADLNRLDAAFLTNAAMGVRPVATVDDVRWTAEPPALRRLRAAYADLRPDPL